jgi:hypothetical protein
MEDGSPVWMKTAESTQPMTEHAVGAGATTTVVVEIVTVAKDVSDVVVGGRVS